MTYTIDDADKLCLFDDEFFRIFIDGHPECTAEILKVVLGMPKIRIIRHKVQKQLSNGRMRGVRLDVYAENEENGDLYNIEIQNTKETGLAQRSRFYSALIDTKCSIKKKEPFTAMPKSFVIFICKDDILKADRAICRFERRTEDGIELGDGSTIIFVNGSYEGTDDLGLLVKDFHEKDSGKIRNSVFANRYVEAEVERRDKMVITHLDKMIMDAEEEGTAKGIAKGIAEGEARKEAELVRNMLSKSDMSCEEIANLTGIPLDNVKKIAESA